MPLRLHAQPLGIRTIFATLSDQAIGFGNRGSAAKMPQFIRPICPLSRDPRSDFGVVTSLLMNLGHK